MSIYYVNIIYHSNIPGNDSTATVLKSFSSSSTATTARGSVQLNEYNKWNGASSVSFPDYVGHSFVGWNTKADGSGSQYSPGSSIYVDGIIDRSHPYTKSLFAVWKPIINKVIYDSETLIDLTGDTVDEQYLMQGYTAHKSDGSTISGTAIQVYPIEVVRLI